MTSPEWNPQRARGKRPLPFWIAEFVKDTLDLERDEIGGYFLLLATMWSRPSCDLPNDPRKLARICRCPSTLHWKRRLAPVLLPFFTVTKNAIFSEKLRKEAQFCEKYLVNQRCRKTKENPDKYLKNIGWPKTADETTENLGRVPTSLPNNPTIKNPSDSRDFDYLPLFDGQQISDDPKPPPKSRFDEFWAAYPHRGNAKRGRKQSVEKFAAAVKRGVPEQVIIDGAIRFQRDKKAIEGFAPDPAAWLHQVGWEDEIEPMSRMGDAPPAPSAERDEVRRKVLQDVADRMVPAGGSSWTIGGRFVTDADLQGIWELGLAPEKVGKKS